MNKTIEYLNSLLNEIDSLVVATSGGPDSMCLLHLLNALRKTKDINIIVAHVNHGLRKESTNEEQMLKDYCLANDLIIEIKHLNLDKDNFSEQTARKERYKFFEELIKKYKAKYLFTAHHGDDLMETILMRLTRGSNLSGYLGIKKLSNKKGFNIVRPLLNLTKEDIYNYLKEYNIPYAEDKTNESLDYTRNRYRHKILPILKEEEKNVHLKYLQFSEELEDYDNFVNSYIKNNKLIVDNSVLINKVKDESLFIKRKCLELIIEDIQLNDYFDISNAQVKEMLNLFETNGNKSIDLNNNYKCIKDYEKIRIEKNNSKSTEFRYILDKDIETSKWKITQVQDVGDSNFEIRLNSKDLKLPLIVRSRLASDKIEVKNLRGSQKVKDIFIDKKVNLEDRDLIPIVTDSNNIIVWIPGIKKSKFAKDKTEKYDIILRCEVEKNECQTKTNK